MGSVVNKNNSPVNIRFVTKTSDIRNFSENIRSGSTGPNRNCNLKVICFQRGPQQPLKCVSTLLLKLL